MTAVDVMAQVGSLLEHHPGVRDVRLVGSRARGTSTELSDWDFRIESPEPDQVAVDLPTVIQPLQPLAAQWDRLSHRAVFMVILAGAIKVDLFPAELTREVAGPWEPDATNLHHLDAHFWDWTLWLGGKDMSGHDQLVRSELHKLFCHLLRPLGATHPPEKLRATVREYLSLRATNERSFGVQIDPRLGSQVLRRLHAHNVV